MVNVPEYPPEYDPDHAPPRPVEWVVTPVAANAATLQRQAATTAIQRATSLRGTECRARSTRMTGFLLPDLRCESDRFTVTHATGPRKPCGDISTERQQLPEAQPRTTMPSSSLVRIAPGANVM